MFKLYKDAFRATNEGFILTIPIALFWWLITLYINYSFDVVDTIPEVILSVFTMLFMTSAFCSGWFYMVKKVVKFSKKHFIFDKDRASESIRLIRSIPKGIGRYFLHYIEASTLFVAMALLLGAVLKFFTAPFVSRINDILASYSINVSSPAEMSAVLDKFPADRAIELLSSIAAPSLELVSAVILIPTIFSFLVMLWMPEVIYTRKNPIIALFTSIRKLFIKFFNSVKLYIYIAIIQMLVSAVGAFSLTNPIIYMIAMVLYFYSLVYVVVLIFYYYDNEFTGELNR